MSGLSEILISKIKAEGTEYIELLKNRFIEYRNKLEAKKKDNNKSRTRIQGTKLKDCISRNGILFIVEGQSAGGNIIKCRNKNIHALMPLKGKPLNVDKATNSRILQNEEFKELISYIGAVTYKGNEWVPTDNCRYGKIVIAADGDADGYHIAALLIIFFNKIMPSLIKEGKLFVAITPLYTYKKKGKLYSLYSEEEAKKAISEGIRITRHKGLGEFDPDEIEEVLIKNPYWIKVE